MCQLSYSGEGSERDSTVRLAWIIRGTLLYNKREKDK